MGEPAVRTGLGVNRRMCHRARQCAESERVAAVAPCESVVGRQAGALGRKRAVGVRQVRGLRSRLPQPSRRGSPRRSGFGLHLQKTQKKIRISCPADRAKVSPHRETMDFDSDCDEWATREWRVWISEIEISQPEASCHQQICKSHQRRHLLPALF